MLADNKKRNYKPVFGSIKMLLKHSPFALRAWVKDGPVQNSLHCASELSKGIGCT